MVALAVLMLTAASCGTEFARDDAISAVQSTGVTEAEATCITDSLIVLDQLDAADPRNERTPERRDAFVAATSRCVTTEVLGASSEFEVYSIEAEVQASNIEDSSGGPQAPNACSDCETDSEDAQDQAVAVLVRQGRSEVNARCIVDFLHESQGTAVFLDPNFGLGLDALEANAIAVCLTVG